MTPFQRSTRLSANSWRVVVERPESAGWWTAYVLIQTLPILLLARRWSGTITQPPTFALLLTAALATIGMTALLRQTQRYIAVQGFAFERQIVLLGALSLPCLLMMLALSTSRASLAGIIISWCLIVGVESSWWTRSVSLWRNAGASRGAASSTAVTQPRPDPLDAIGDARVPGMLDESSMESLPDDVTQQVTRANGAEGRETVDGFFRVTFDAQERQKPVHIGFCPPLSRKPEFHVEQIDGPSAQVEIGQLESFGVRLELRLERPTDQKTSIVCQFEAFG